MPTMDATTTSVFEAIGLNPTTIYNVFVSLVGTAVSFGLWLIQVAWPFLLGIMLIGALWGIANHYRHVGGQ